MLRETIHDLARQYADEFIDIRHHLHAHPELSYQEFKTSAFVQEKLKSWGITYNVIAGTGIVGLIQGKQSDRVIALRADMDALPITEANDVNYASRNSPALCTPAGQRRTYHVSPGGRKNPKRNAAKNVEGTVKLIFQPGEEKNPGGASLMIKEGALENPKPQGIITPSMCIPRLRWKNWSFRPGMVMASADEIYMTIRGKGGHAATPHLTTDTILITSQLEVSFWQAGSSGWNRNSLLPFRVVHFCLHKTGHTTNVIPSEVKLMGTFRAMDEDWRFRAHDLIRKQATELVHSMGGEIDLHIDVGYPVLYNQETFSKKNRKLAEAYLDPEHVETTELRMASEDFSYYTHVIPGCFFRLGTRNESLGFTSGVHTPTFNIDENAIELGIGAMAWLGAQAEI